MSEANLRGGSLTVKPNSEELIKLRHAKNLKQSEVEDAIGIKRLRLSMYERNSPVPIKTIIKLAKFYGVTPQELADPVSLANNAQLTLELVSLHGFSITADNPTDQK